MATLGDLVTRNLRTAIAATSVLLTLLAGPVGAQLVTCQKKPGGGCTDATSGRECALAGGNIGLCLPNREPIPDCTCQPPVVCTFDTNGDGSAELRLGDADADGLCEWPQGTTSVRGTLTFTAATPVEFAGKTTVVADAVAIEDGALLIGEPSRLARLTLSARSSGLGGVVSRGRLDIGASDDIVLDAGGSVDLGGSARLVAGGVVVLRARQGDVDVAPAVRASDGAFDLFARTRVEITARGKDGNVDVAGATIGSYRIVVSTRANLSVVGAKHLTVSDGAKLVTDRARTGLPNASNIQLDATGRIALTRDVELDAGTLVSFSTRRPQDDVCLSERVTVAADNGLGRILFTSVQGLVIDDGTTQFVGRVLGADRIVAGTCAGILAGDVEGPMSVSNGAGSQTSDVSGRVVLGLDGRITELTMLATPVAVSGGSSGLMTLELDGGAPISGGFSGSALTTTFTVLVNSNQVDAALGSVQDTPFCIGGADPGRPCIDVLECPAETCTQGACSRSGATCGTDADCGAPSCRSDAAHGSFAPCAGRITGTAVSPGQIEGQLRVECTSGSAQPSVGTAVTNVTLAARNAPNPQPCPANKQCHKKKTCLQPVLIAKDDGTMPAACPAFTTANTLWTSCCVGMDVKASKTIKKTAFQDIEDAGDGPVMLSTEAKAMVAAENDDATTAGCIEVYCVKNVSKLSCLSGTPKKPEPCHENGSTAAPCSMAEPCKVIETGKDVSGGGFVAAAGTAKAKLIIVEGAHATVLAHEVGHTLGLLGHDYVHGTIMEPSALHDKACPEKTRLADCKTAHANGNAKIEKNAQGKEIDCCKKPDIE